MALTAPSKAHGVCPEEVVCECLRVTAGEVLDALATGAVRTLKDLKHETGAGDGCMVCHRVLRKYLERHADYSASSSSSSPAAAICSVR
jgi:NAD(P)H-nitrite reductase large subunit